MNEIYIAVLALSIINVVIAIINIITNGRLSRVYDEYETVRDELKSAEDKLSEVYDRFEGESDVICRMVDAHRLLKKDHEKDHLLTMTMYNEYMNNKDQWKKINKYMEENEKTIKPLAEFEDQKYTLEEMIQVYELIERSLKHAISNLTAGVDTNDKRNVKLLASSIIARIVDMTEDEIKKLELLSEMNESVEDVCHY